MASPAACGACGHPICDRFILRVSDVSYHERCLACSACGALLQHTCYTRQAKLYCRIDYDRSGKNIVRKEMLGLRRVRRCGGVGDESTGRRFPRALFVCVVCGGRLQRGDHYVLKQGQLFCRPDYDKEVEMFQGYTQGELMCDELVTSRCSDGRRGPKRPRTILTTQQRRAFKASFEMSPKPCRKIREGLAKDTGLSVRIVQVWFQNQRAKMKKIQKKARDNKAGSCGSKESCDVDGDKSKIKIKEENQSPHGLAMFLNDSCSDNDIPGADAECAGDSHRHFLPIKEELNSQDGFYKNNNSHSNIADFSNASNGEKMGAAFLSFPYASEQQHALQQFLGTPTFAHAYGNPSLNPIDRLYSMQSSYFCTEETTMVDE